jgi:phenylpyruvate tautomerase PptA (4-oxalocrotonate tautomerase family)
MPYLKIQTNCTVKNSDKLLEKTSAYVAKMLSKPEKFVMIQIEENQQMIFGASKEPLLYCELKSIGLPEDKTREISGELSAFLASETTISENRIYIEFSNAERHMWGWNGSTFQK